MRAARGSATLVIVCTLGLALVACGSGSSDDSSTSASGSSDDAALVKEARRIVDAGTQETLYYNGDEKSVDPSSAESVAPGEWRGPTSPPDPQPGKKVKVISCVAGSACEDIGMGAVEAGKKLGWDV